MYRIVEMTDTVRIPPDKMGGDMTKVLEELVHESFEGHMTKSHGITVLTTDVEPLSEGTIIHGDGAIYQHVKFNALVFRPDPQEIIDGIVCEIVEFGCFVHIGPLDALVHMSQIMNDYVSVDMVNERIVGKESKRALEVSDSVRARTVTASLNELSPRESKIGLTMRQPALGKFEWLEADKKRRSEPSKDQKPERKQKSERKQEQAEAKR